MKISFSAESEWAWHHELSRTWVKYHQPNIRVPQFGHFGILTSCLHLRLGYLFIKCLYVTSSSLKWQCISLEMSQIVPKLIILLERKAVVFSSIQISESVNVRIEEFYQLLIPMTGVSATADCSRQLQIVFIPSWATIDPVIIWEHLASAKHVNISVTRSLRATGGPAVSSPAAAGGDHCDVRTQ